MSKLLYRSNWKGNWRNHSSSSRGPFQEKIGRQPSLIGVMIKRMRIEKWF